VDSDFVTDEEDEEDDDDAETEVTMHEKSEKRKSKVFVLHDSFMRATDSSMACRYFEYLYVMVKVFWICACVFASVLVFFCLNVDV